jgi:hypothetical protein
MFRVWTNFCSPQIALPGSRPVRVAPDTGPGVNPMKSVSSDQIYLWSKRLGLILLLAMAIVAVGNAQQSSGGEKGKLNVAGDFDF